MVKVNLYFTTSKLAAYLVLIIGSIFGFLFQDGGVLLATFSAVSAILMMKTYTQSRTDQKQIENPIQSKPEDINVNPDGKENKEIG